MSAGPVVKELRREDMAAPERRPSDREPKLPPAPQLEFPKGPMRPTPGRAREVKVDAPPLVPAAPAPRTPAQPASAPSAPRKPAPPRKPMPRVQAPRRSPSRARRPRAPNWRLRAGLAGAVVLVVAVLGAIYGPGLYRYLDLQWNALNGSIALETAVERIVMAESGGDANARNKRSTAVGAGQFLDQTWLELVRAHRADLARLGEKETLELRRDPRLAREMTARFLERNAVLLRRQCHPVTLAAAYLAHFAGGAGAAAILSAPDAADAAAVMAKADATGRTTREKIVKANPFLESYTVADMKVWAERKMRGREVLLAAFVPLRGPVSDAALLVRIPAASAPCRRATSKT
jgi:hypothetical protein